MEVVATAPAACSAQLCYHNWAAKLGARGSALPWSPSTCPGRATPVPLPIPPRRASTQTAIEQSLSPRLLEQVRLGVSNFAIYIQYPIEAGATLSEGEKETYP